MPCARHPSKSDGFLPDRAAPRIADKNGRTTRSVEFDVETVESEATFAVLWDCGAAAMSGPGADPRPLLERLSN
jgi:hypothetical protein